MEKKYNLIESGKFRRDLKKFLRNPALFEDIASTLEILEISGVKGISKKMVPHQLKGKYKDNWECHVRPDLLLIWFQFDEPTNTIYLTRIGSHSDLF